MNGTSVVPEAQVVPAGAPVAVTPGRGGAVTPVEMSVDIRKSEKVVDNVNSQVPKPTEPVSPGAPIMPQPPVEPPVVPSDPTEPPVVSPTVPPVVTPTVPPVVTPTVPPVVAPTVPPVVTPDPVQYAGIKWGRWQEVAYLAPNFNLTIEGARNQLVAVVGNFAVFRTAGKEYTVPERGNTGFKLADSQAFIHTHYGTTSVASAASMSNGKLNVDFGSKAFTTSFDLANKDEKFSFNGSGVVTADGTLYGDRSNGRRGVLNVQGLLSGANGGSASYIFDGRIDDQRTINGGTYWTPQAQ